MNAKYRSLNADQIVKTQGKLVDRIAKRFPESGLAEVAAELQAAAAETTSRAKKIRRPNLALRFVVAGLLAGFVLLLVLLGRQLTVKADLQDVVNLMQFAEATAGTFVFVGVAMLFAWSLEARWKRKQALAALHELRSMAHVVDLHQLTKHPEGIVHRGPPLSVDEAQTTQSLYELNRYLNYCIELLAIISKLAPLYVQQYPDGPTVEAVDQVENLCSALSHKIWQKIMVLDRFLDEEEHKREVEKE